MATQAATTAAACYFLLNVVLVSEAGPDVDECGRGLLFSFECC